MKKIKNYFHKYSYRNLSFEIKEYGYHYSFRNFCIQMIIVLIGACIAGYYYQLKANYIAIVAAVSIAVFPIIVLAQFKHLYNNKRFRNLDNYLERMIIFFKQNPKIITALQETKKYCDQQTADAIEEALKILEFDNSADYYLKAFEPIEKLYHNSRLEALHRFMITVENENSANYISTLNSFERDVQKWVKRSYVYSSELKTNKFYVYIMIVGVIAILMFMSSVYVQLDRMSGFLGNSVYQMISAGFLIIGILLITIIQVKVNSKWIVDDLSDRDDQKALKALCDYQNFNYRKELKGKGFILAVICVFMAMSVAVMNINFLLCFAFLGVFVACKPLFKKNRLKTYIKEELTREVPLWLRTMSLNLTSNVVTRSIELSLESSSEILKPFLQKLLNEIDDDPIAIDPYDNFLKEYDIENLSTTMRLLYSLQEVSDDNSSEEVDELVDRNQSMIVNAEEVSNGRVLAIVGSIQFIPVLIGSFKIFADMAIIFIGMISHINSIVHF